jgi:parallel beta-helix repeat protein
MNRLKVTSTFICILAAVLMFTACNLGKLPPGSQTPTHTNTPITATPTETLPPAGPAVLYVDDFGANPYDQQPDSEAIQAALDALESGDTLMFTSPSDNAGYFGYQINKTIYIIMDEPKQNLTLTSTDPENPAQLNATPSLLGFVVHLFSRRHIDSHGLIDDITLEHLHIDAGREMRICAGPDQISNGNGDNWGSWVMGECRVPDDPWCHAGGISLAGAVDFSDYGQNYATLPARWTTGLKVNNLTITNVECGTALGLSGAASAITNTIIDTAGEHTHVSGCDTTDPDGELAFWSDGITFDGTEILIENNTIINASDVGIVFFGGKDTRILDNTVISEDGNYGAFAAIAVHTWGFGDISGLEVSGNTVTSTSDTRCGGLHAGINIGTQMWGGGCREAGSGTVGLPGDCDLYPSPPEGAHCIVGQQCQIWAYVPTGETITLSDNTVTGAHINFLIGGLDNQGELIIENNTSLDPQRSDWQAATHGCHGRTWGPLDFVALYPAIPGWTEQRVFCER